MEDYSTSLNPGRREWVRFAAVLLLLAVVRIPALSGPANLSWDATEYVDIARNIANGEGAILKIRAYFFADGYGLPYPAASLRSLLFPFLMGRVYALLPTALVFQWFNFALFLANITLLWLLLRRALPAPVALYSACLVGLSEPMFLTSVFPWAEQTAFFWLLLSMLLASLDVTARFGRPGAVVTGLVAGMASLSRPEYLLVGVLFLAWLLRDPSRRATVPFFLIGLAVPPLGGAWLNYSMFGRTFLPGSYLFRSGGYEAYFSWMDVNSRTSGDFVARNPLWIMGRILRNLVNYVAKLIGWKNLLFMTAAVPFVVRNAVSGQYDWRRRQLLFVATAFFGSYCLVWGGIDRERYLLAVTSFLLPLCVLEVDRFRRSASPLWVRRAATFVLLVNLPLNLANVLVAGVKVQERAGIGERFYASENAAWLNPDMDALVTWVRDHVAKDEVLCLENPFLLNFHTGRPAVMLPERLPPELLPKFFSTYRVRWFVSNSVYTKRQRADIESLEESMRRTGAGEPVLAGSYRIWRVAGPASR